MPKRRKFVSPEKLLYDLDVEFRYDLLGKRVAADLYVEEMLRALSTRKSEPSQLEETRTRAREMMREAFAALDPEDVAAFEKMASDGLIFASIAKAIERRDSALAVAVTRAFALAKLDPADVGDWYILMTRFCWAHFEEHANPGRKDIVWTEEKYRTLLQDIERAKRVLDTSEDASALRALEDKYRLSYERLKTALREARDPDYNRALIQPMYAALNAELDRSPAGFISTEAEDEFRKAFCRAEADRIGQSED